MLYLFKPSGIIPYEYRKVSKESKKRGDKIYRVCDESKNECYTFLICQRPDKTCKGFYVSVKSVEEAFEEVRKEFPHGIIEEL